MPKKQYKAQIDQALANLKALQIQDSGKPDVPKLYWKLDEPVSTLFDEAGLDCRHMQSWWFLVHALASVHKYDLPPSKKWTDERRRRLVDAAIYVRSKPGNSSLEYLPLCTKLVGMAGNPAPDARLVEIAGVDLIGVLEGTTSRAVYSQLIAEIAEMKSHSKSGGKSLFEVVALSTLKKLQPKK